jgi:hypothetical protein
MSQGTYGLLRPGGDIVTLLDLTPRDVQDAEFFPLQSEKTWWLPDSERRIRPYSLSVQQFPFRGPTAFGQRFTFDIASTTAGDLLLSAVLQINLGHWIDQTTLARLQTGAYEFKNPSDAWFYANSLGTVILQKAELEVNDQTIEVVDGDFLNVASLLFQDMNNQYGLAVDGLGRRPFDTLQQTPLTQPFPCQTNTIFIPLPFFFQRVRLQEVLPLLACKENSVRIHVTLRPFHECVRRITGLRESCTEVPLNITIPFTNTKSELRLTTEVKTLQTPPAFDLIQLVTTTAQTDGELRQRILRSPFESLVRIVDTFSFDEPLKYLTNKSTTDTIQLQLPLEVNHPMEEILWFVRRKAVANNNEWTNYSNVLSPEFNAIYNPRSPMLKQAVIQLNGTELINQEEQWFRQHIALRHKGGAAAYENFIYGYSFAETPGEHQPSGTANASRLQSVRLTLDISPPGGAQAHDWEVKVFVVSLQWLRYQDGIVNRIFTD